MLLSTELTPTHEQWEQARDFAERSIESRRAKIAARGQHKLTKILNDICYGTVAEFAVSDYLNQCGIITSVPDTTVYSVRQKSWAADLTCDYGNIHVKSCADPRYDSWVFQWAAQIPGVEGRPDCDPICYDKHPQDYLILTRVDPLRKTVELAYVLWQPLVVELFELPQLPQLRRSKRVLYPDTLNRQLPKQYWEQPSHLCDFPELLEILSEANPR